MEKYATYHIFKNTVTGEVKRIPEGDQQDLEKTAEDSV